MALNIVGISGKSCHLPRLFWLSSKVNWKQLHCSQSLLNDCARLYSLLWSKEDGLVGLLNMLKLLFFLFFSFLGATTLLFLKFCCWWRWQVPVCRRLFWQIFDSSSNCDWGNGSLKRGRVVGGYLGCCSWGDCWFWDCCCWANSHANGSEWDLCLFDLKFIHSISKYISAIRTRITGDVVTKKSPLRFY